MSSSPPSIITQATHPATTTTTTNNQQTRMLPMEAYEEEHSKGLIRIEPAIYDILQYDKTGSTQKHVSDAICKLIKHEDIRACTGFLTKPSAYNSLYTNKKGFLKTWVIHLASKSRFDITRLQKWTDRINKIQVEEHPIEMTLANYTMPQNENTRKRARSVSPHNNHPAAHQTTTTTNTSSTPSDNEDTSPSNTPPPSSHHTHNEQTLAPQSNPLPQPGPHKATKRQKTLANANTNTNNQSQNQNTKRTTLDAKIDQFAQVMKNVHPACGTLLWTLYYDEIKTAALDNTMDNNTQEITTAQTALVNAFKNDLPTTSQKHQHTLQTLLHNYTNLLLNPEDTAQFHTQIKSILQQASRSQSPEPNPQDNHPYPDTHEDQSIHQHQQQNQTNTHTLDEINKTLQAKLDEKNNELKTLRQKNKLADNEIHKLLKYREQAKQQKQTIETLMKERETHAEEIQNLTIERDNAILQATSQTANATTTTTSTNNA